MAITRRRVPRKDFEALSAQAETDVQPRFRDFPALKREGFAFLEEQPARKPRRTRR
jgi:hypothetical protein